MSITGSFPASGFASRSGGFDLGQDIMMLAFSEVADLCALSATGKPPTADLTWLTVFICTGEGSAIGDYVIGPGDPGTPCTRGSAWAWLRQFISGTGIMVHDDGGGSVAITGGNNTPGGTSEPVAGSLQVNFGNRTNVGPAYTGSFSLTYCSTLNQ